eukprot:1030629_1
MGNTIPLFHSKTIDDNIQEKELHYTATFNHTGTGKHIVAISPKKIKYYDPNYERTDAHGVLYGMEPSFSTILFGDAVTSDMCNKFEITISYRRSRNVESRNYRYFMLGFTTQRNGDYGITNWNEG